MAKMANFKYRVIFLSGPPKKCLNGKHIQVLRLLPPTPLPPPYIEKVPRMGSERGRFQMLFNIFNA